MTDLDFYVTHIILKKIELKENNLKIYLPEINYLHFIDEVEQFEDLIEGIGNDCEPALVNLSLAKSKFRSLHNSYLQLLSILEKNSRKLSFSSKRFLLKQFLENILTSELFVSQQLKDFYNDVLSSTNCLYNINAIVKVYDLLLRIQTEARIVVNNFENLKRSTLADKIKELLLHLYESALHSSHLKYKNVIKKFPYKEILKEIYTNSVIMTDNEEKKTKPTTGLIPSELQKCLALISTEGDIQERTMKNKSDEICAEKFKEEFIPDLKGFRNANDEDQCPKIDSKHKIGRQETKACYAAPCEEHKEQLRQMVQNKMDFNCLSNEEYVKYTLGKPLQQALAAITILQPRDPVRYLANFLLKYRDNELQNTARNKDFDTLMVNRERYARQIDLEKGAARCDPCISARCDDTQF